MPRLNDSFSILVIAAASLGGCAKAPAPQKDIRAAHLAKLDAMGRKCGYPRSEWTLVETEELHLKPDPNERYEAVDCMLREIKRSHIPFDLGFVGNEAYEPGNSQ